MHSINYWKQNGDTSPENEKHGTWTQSTGIDCHAYYPLSHKTTRQHETALSCQCLYILTRIAVIFKKCPAVRNAEQNNE